MTNAASQTGASTPTTVELVFVNNSQCEFKFKPQLIMVSAAPNGTATLNHTGEVSVSSGETSTAVSITMTPSGAKSTDTVVVGLQLDGTVSGATRWTSGRYTHDITGTTHFSMVQTIGVSGGTAAPIGFGLSPTWPPSSTPTLSADPNTNGAYQLTLTIDADFALKPENRFSVVGTQVHLNGEPFFARGINYAPTPVGGATFAPGIGDWFTPPLVDRRR